MEWSELCIEDKHGKYFKCSASPLSFAGELRTLKRHLEQARKHPELYKFLDLDSARIIVDGQPLEPIEDFKGSDDDLLKELGL